MSNAAAGKHWYNNGIEQKYFSECPEGWKPGRLPISEETRRKHIENNGMHNMTEEQKQARLDKIKAFRENESLEHKKHKSEAISAATKGKHEGRQPWNKGKKGVQKAWNKGIKMGKPSWNAGVKMSDDARKHMSEAQKGKTAWNKGKHYHFSEEFIKERAQKEYETKKKNNTFNTSAPEELYYSYLKEKYGEENVKRQYSDSRYPFRCDFYISSEDLFIELNLSWTHGGKLFDINSSDDLEKIERWKNKAQTSDFYKNAIETWTVRDVIKYNTFIKNNLNFKIYYNEGELYE